MGVIKRKSSCNTVGLSSKCGNKRDTVTPEAYAVHVRPEANAEVQAPGIARQSRSLQESLHGSDIHCLSPFPDQLLLSLTPWGLFSPR